jgi:FtsP/CotA-like multicopper oxidase with cupredoxin domain
MADAREPDGVDAVSEDNHPESSTRRGPRVTRRGFLIGVGVIGVGAGAVALGVSSLERTPPSAGTDSSPAASPGPSPGPSPDPLRPSQLSDLTETWSEPAVWSPNGTEQLVHTVVENQNGFRFSYDGASPGPTVRMRGNETLYVRLQNDLSEDVGTTPVGPNPDPGEGYPGPEGAMLQQLDPADQYGKGRNRIPTEPRQDWSLGEHVNGVHSAHVTNLHTHGVHVAPGKNDNGTHSDDIYLRVVPEADARKIAENPQLYRRYQEEREEIIGSSADFEFRLGNVMEGLPGPDGEPLHDLPHPPGTHWYHPHSHGATQNQVASGMAGFLIVEGDVDDELRARLGGAPDAAWDHKSGQWDYRERDFFLQRVFQGDTINVGGPAAGPDPDALKMANPPKPMLNGTDKPGIIVMRPGAIERWRVLNGSVDGAGFMRFAVLKGHFDLSDRRTARVSTRYFEALSPIEANTLRRVEFDGDKRIDSPVVVNDHSPLRVETAQGTEPVEKADLWQLAWDGVTLMRQDDGGSWRYALEDLSAVNGGREPQLGRLADCYQAENVAQCYSRPNEIAMGDANRADVLFQAPPVQDDVADMYTVVALPTQLHGSKESTIKILARVVVRGETVPGGQGYAFDGLLADLDVSPYELPVTDDELAISSPAERAARGAEDGTYRTRVVRYAGWGSNEMPLIEANPEYIAANPDKEKLSWYAPPPPDSTEYRLPVSDNDQTGVRITNITRFPEGDLPAIVLPQNTRTMSIDGEKFDPTSSSAPRLQVNTAEEWAVYNQSIELYSVPTPDSTWTREQTRTYLERNPELIYYGFEYVDQPPDGAPASPQEYFMGHRISYPLTLTEVAEINAAREAEVGEPWERRGILGRSTGAVDHPFHIHQNPFWLTRIDVPDEQGNLVNILRSPRWADVVQIPRNGGRVVFRSRFVDYEGEFVDHCHILLHEDNGMMQRVQVVADPADTNYEPRDVVVSGASSEADVNAVYGKPTAEESWLQSLLFVDANASGQVYPGRDFIPPVPPRQSSEAS